MEDEQVVDGTTPEPVETAEATTAEETQPTETPAEGEEPKEGHPAEPPKKTGIEKRFSELTARAKAAEMYAQRLEQLMERLPQPAQEPPSPQGKPTREQFDYDEDKYIEALTDWKLREHITRQQEEYVTRQKQTETQRRQADYAERVQKANTVGMTKFEDYEDVVLANPELVVTPVMADAMTLTDAGPEIAYHLGKNPQEAKRIAVLPPQVQILEIARLEQKLKAPLPKATTKAPPPVVPVGGHEPATKDPDKMTTAEWMRWREVELKAKRG